MIVRSRARKLYASESSALTGSRGAPIPMFEIECHRAVAVLCLQQPGELFEVDARRSALDTQQPLQVVTGHGHPGQFSQLLECAHRRFEVVPLEQRSLVANLARDDLPSQPHAEQRVGRAVELPATKKHVLQAQPLRKTIEPATKREVRDGCLGEAECLDRGRSHLDVPEHVHLRDLVDPRLLHKASSPALEVLPDFPIVSPCPGDVERAQVVACRHQAPQFSFGWVFKGRQGIYLVKAALDLGVPTYRFLRRYLEHRLPVPLTLRQVDPLIRQLTLYRDLIDRKTGDPV